MVKLRFCPECKKYMRDKHWVCPKCNIPTEIREKDFLPWLAYEPERNPFSMLRA